MKKLLLILALMVGITGAAEAGVLDLFSSKTMKYVKERAQETKLAYTYNFAQQHGSALYLPVLRDIKPLGRRHAWLQGEVGLGYHLEEGGKDTPFFNAGFNLIPIADKILASRVFKGHVSRVPLPPQIWVTVYANLYTGQTWVIGQDVGGAVTAEIFSFGG